MGAICPDCNQDMKVAKGCKMPEITLGRKKFMRICYGYETRADWGRGEDGKIENGRCPDCSATTRRLHHLGCDVEECPKCGGQLISCGCWHDGVDWPDDEIKRVKRKIDSIRQRVPFEIADGHEMASLKDELTTLEDSKAVTSQALVPVNPPEINVDPDRLFKGFYHHSRAWYSAKVSPPDGIVDDIHFGLHHRDGSSSGLAVMEWRWINRDLVPRLTMFDDAWHLLAEIQDLFISLNNYKDRNITPDQFREILLKAGFQDITAVNPPR